MDSAAIAQQLQQYDQKKVTSADALNEALKQYGVPEIRNTVAGLRTTLANTQNAYNSVDPSVTGRTQGSLVTEAQRTKQVANERAPIAGQLSDQSHALSQNTQDLNDALGQANTLATNKVNDYNSGRAALQDQYNTTYKREQDAAAAEAQRQATARAQANEDRNYQLASAKTANSVKQPSAGEIKQQDMATTAQNLQSKVGKDGHVSQETWNKAMADWVKAGYNASEFAKANIQYVNQRYKGYHGYN